MSEEAAFLDQLLETPTDDVTRLVYADWLDEQCETIARQKAKVLRAIVANETSGVDAELWARELAELATGLDETWLAIVGKPFIDGCDRVGFTPARWQFWREYIAACPKRWDCLMTTENPLKRICFTCKRLVDHVPDLETVRQLTVRRSLIKWNEPYVVSIAVRRFPTDTEADDGYPHEHERRHYLDTESVED